MTVFTESNRRSLWRRRSDGEVVASPVAGDDFDREIEYAVAVSQAIERLNVMGFTMERCEREYEEIRQQQLESLRQFNEDQGDQGDASDTFGTDQIAKYERLTFEAYIASFREVFDRRGHWYDITPEQRLNLEPVVSYILDEHHDEWLHFGFFCEDIRSFLRMALSVAAPESTLKQDVSELVAVGWLRDEDQIRNDAVRQLIERFPQNTPLIVVTEGSTDAEILQKSLAILFPHLVGYYTFFDFLGTRAAGGATQLISVVKAFAAAGVANRVIAILDNDTAAHEARRILRDVRLPNNIIVIHYPPRDWLGDYPTLGPSGDVSLDVNGKAASIELYLGRDVLTVDGNLLPVQWVGYSQAMRAYQGEIIDKQKAIERWRAKADSCIADRSSIAVADWDDLREVWNQIMSAFA